MTRTGWCEVKVLKNTAKEFIYFQSVHHSTNQNHQLGKECQEKMRHTAVTLTNLIQIRLKQKHFDLSVTE